MQYFWRTFPWHPQRHHFLLVFVLSNCFYCTEPEPLRTQKARVLLTEQNSVPQGPHPDAWLIESAGERWSRAAIPRAWCEGDAHGRLRNKGNIVYLTHKASSWNSHLLISLSWDILQPHSMPSEAPITAEHLGCWACNFPSLVRSPPHTWPLQGQKHPLIICSLCSHPLLAFQCLRTRAVLRGGRNHLHMWVLSSCPDFKGPLETSCRPHVHYSGVEWR